MSGVRHNFGRVMLIIAHWWCVSILSANFVTFFFSLFVLHLLTYNARNIVIYSFSSASSSSSSSFCCWVNAYVTLNYVIKENSRRAERAIVDSPIKSFDWNNALGWYIDTSSSSPNIDWWHNNNAWKAKEGTTVEILFPSYFSRTHTHDAHTQSRHPPDGNLFESQQLSGASKQAKLCSKRPRDIE